VTDDDGEVCVLAQCGETFVNRVLLGIAEYVMDERIVGLGTDGAHKPISLWTTEGFRGKVMPASVSSREDLVPMTWGTA